MWNVPKIWEGGEVWIIGGGPSVTEQFGIPKKVVKSVVEGTSTPIAYSPYMSAIHDKHVIGINVAYKIGNWIDFVFFGDFSFFLKEKQGLASFKGIKVSCAPQCEKYNWVKFTGRDMQKPRGLSQNKALVSWNGNSGAAAISLAAHLGASRIILLGFDMKLGDNNAQHWHDLYQRKEYLENKDRKKVHLPFDRHLIGFPEIAKDAKKMGIKILNACPDSAINDFPKGTVMDILEGKI
jgi:hypothetical protein